jgi:sensor histidine kinase regulating citrate/malate metabolism
MRNRVPHLSLLTQFSILSLLCVVALGAALVLVLSDQIHDRAAANSRVMAQNIANDIADEHVTGRDLERGLGKRKMDAIDRSIEVLVLRGRIRTAKIYDLQGRIVYSFNRREVGRRELSEEVQLALEGHTQAAFEGVQESIPGAGQVYEVYVPLRLLGDDGPAGVFEVYMPYAPIAAQIDKDSRRL